MSFAAALLILAGAPAASLAAPPSAAEEIVVIGRQLEEEWRGKLVKEDGRLACRTTKSTGDTAIDAIGCGAMIACTGPVESRIDTIAAAGVPTRERNRQIEQVLQSTIPCLAEFRRTAIAQLVAARARS